MIDCKKLKFAHYICVGTDFYISAEFGHLGGAFIYILNKSQNRRVFETQDTDELITKLNELTKPEPKYKEGWFLRGSTPVMCKCAPDCDGYAVNMDEDDDISAESWGKIMYPTREDLIKSQLLYWHGLLFPEDAKASCCSVQSGTSEECGEFYL